MAQDCKCIVKHAVTTEERRALERELEYARCSRDRIGMTLMITQLAPCPVNLVTEPAPEEVAEPTRKGRLSPWAD